MEALSSASRLRALASSTGCTSLRKARAKTPLTARSMPFSKRSRTPTSTPPSCARPCLTAHLAGAGAGTPRASLTAGFGVGCTAGHVLTSSGCSREWRNRQTRTVQVRVPERTWGFNSPLAHTSRPPPRPGGGLSFPALRLTVRRCAAAGGPAMHAGGDGGRAARRMVRVHMERSAVPTAAAATPDGLVGAYLRGVRYDYCDAACATAHRRPSTSPRRSARLRRHAVGDTGCCASTCRAPVEHGTFPATSSHALATRRLTRRPADRRLGVAAGRGARPGRAARSARLERGEQPLVEDLLTLLRGQRRPVGRRAPAPWPGGTTPTGPPAACRAPGGPSATWARLASRRATSTAAGRSPPAAPAWAGSAGAASKPTTDRPRVHRSTRPTCRSPWTRWTSTRACRARQRRRPRSCRAGRRRQGCRRARLRPARAGAASPARRRRPAVAVGSRVDRGRRRQSQMELGDEPAEPGGQFDRRQVHADRRRAHRDGCTWPGRRTVHRSPAHPSRRGNAAGSGSRSPPGPRGPPASATAARRKLRDADELVARRGAAASGPGVRCIDRAPQPRDDDPLPHDDVECVRPRPGRDSSTAPRSPPAASRAGPPGTPARTAAPRSAADRRTPGPRRHPPRRRPIPPPPPCRPRCVRGHTPSPPRPSAPRRPSPGSAGSGARRPARRPPPRRQVDHALPRRQDAVVVHSGRPPVEGTVPRRRVSE